MKQTAAAATIDMPEQETPDQMEVLDTTCTPKFPERVHEVLLEDGLTKEYTFKRGERVTMPFAHAMQFLRDPAFHVFEPGSDDKYDPTPEQPTDGNLVLAPGMVVARLDELTGDALAIRAAGLPGGDGFRKNSKKDDMVAFLLAYQSGGLSIDVDDREDESGDVDEDGDFVPAAFDESLMA